MKWLLIISSIHRDVEATAADRRVGSLTRGASFRPHTPPHCSTPLLAPPTWRSGTRPDSSKKSSPPTGRNAVRSSAPSCHQCSCQTQPRPHQGKADEYLHPSDNQLLFFFCSETSSRMNWIQKHRTLFGLVNVFSSGFHPALMFLLR